jgi:protease-4
MVRALEAAAGDEKIKGVYLTGNSNGMGFAASQEVRNALDSMRRAGKFVYAAGDVLAQRGFELMGAADSIFCFPGGFSQWNGYVVEIPFFKGTLDKLEVKPEVFFAGQFKSATEPYRLSKMSDANRLQLSVFINELYGQFLSAVADRRGVDTAELHNLANNMAVNTATDAVRAGLVDAVLYEDEVRDTMKKRLGLKHDAKIPFITLQDYAKRQPWKSSTEISPDKIAVIYAEGEIIDGKEEDGAIGGEAYRNLLRKARLDKKIKAVVLRVNSPGGSALASEMIAREVELLKKEKPVVVSMGDYAASGGYYISCLADSIFAQPATLTGSIGVFSLMFDVSKLMNNKLGVTFDAVKTSPGADFMTPFRPMTDLERRVSQSIVDSIYLQFKSRVAAGRGLSLATVDSLGQGRIWSGSNAVKNGLADRLGGLNDALACAARMAKIEQYELREWPVIPSLIEKILGDEKQTVSTSKATGNKVVASSGNELTWMHHLRQLQRMQGAPQARLPFSLVLR